MADVRIESGALRHKVTIKAPTETPSARGGVTTTWAGTDTRRCAIRPLTGREFQEAQATHSDVTHRVIMRYYSGLTPEYKLVFGSRTFQVTRVLTKDEVHRIMELEVKETTT